MADVFLSPEGGHDAAALCEQAAAQLMAQTRSVAALTDGVYDGWLGDCAEGRGWVRLLEEKATGANSLRWLLERHAANLNMIADQFRSTTEPYGEADSKVMGRQWSTE
ncbi:MAG TPA: hypothetical protein VFB19_07030 [Mycobacterium sp.]|nr:hypothetical protein [Mycobacterium sp.]